MKKTDHIFQCINCGNRFNKHEAKYLCPDCEKTNSATSPPKGVLKTVYDYENLKNEISGFSQLKQNNFIDLLPIQKLDSLPNLRIGNTPLYSIKKIDNSKLPFNLFLKDDSQNPTFSFKDRASAIVSAYAKENGFNTIVTASTGNAGSSLAGICASQGQKAIIIVPETAPAAKLTQIIMYGAKIILIKGNYDDAFDLSVEASKEFGWYNRNTAFNPLTIEGKKTVSFELFEQMNYTVPDNIFVPVGDGVIISSVYKGFEDLLKLKIINKIPCVIAIQSDGSNNLIRNISKEKFISKSSSTIADSISVDIPRNFYMAQHFIRTYLGNYLSVSDDEIIKASLILSKNTGIFSEPAAAAAFAGLLSYSKNNQIADNSNNIVLLTGSGLKDLSSVKKIFNISESIKPSIKEMKKLF